MKGVIKYYVVLLIILSFSIQNSNCQEEDLLYRRHVLNTTFNGLLYGVAIDVIAELDGAAAAGVPIITAGGGLLIPLIKSDKSIDYDALVMGNHGRSIGWVQGVGLAALIGGEKAFWGPDSEDTTSNNYKYTIGVGALTSLGMGILGGSLAKNNEWTEGQVELYRQYGWLGSFTGFSLAAAFSDEPRVYGASTLALGLGGYLVANGVNNWNEFTRGEMRATQVLSLLNLGLGIGIFADLEEETVDEDESDDIQNINWLIPAAGAIGGTIAGHFWTRNTNLTPRQGMLTAYAGGGGALLGLGIALITNSDNVTPYYLIPYATGMAAYAYTLEHLRRKNATSSSSFLHGSKKNNFSFALMPQSLIINNRIMSNSYVPGRTPRMQPLFAASVRF